MAKLIYSMIPSFDGYAEAAEGDLGTGADDQEVHTFINDLFRPVGTCLYDRRMYETMVYWKTAHIEPDQSPHILQYAGGLKAEADHDLTVDGPNLAAQAIAAGLVDEYHLFITTSVLGGGKRFFPDVVRLDLDLVEQCAPSFARTHRDHAIVRGHRTARKQRLTEPSPRQVVKPEPCRSNIYSRRTPGVLRSTMPPTARSKAFVLPPPTPRTGLARHRANVSQDKMRGASMPFLLQCAV